MLKSLLIQRALPLSISYILLIIAGIALDYLLHVAHLVWIGRYFGIVGTLFLALSFGYSARKQKLIKNGALKFFLKFHCYSGWVGTLMILVHSGIHFNALLPWIATALMMVVTASGHVGQYLVKKLKEEMKQKMKQLGITTSVDNEFEQQHFWDSLTVKALDQWRGLHMPLVSFLLALTTIHILAILFFWNWR
uniref:DUF4149 domain-containing protein n=1 Tax=Chlorobium chlorochromatii (strain CaD3) TaxID=340177 RepID=Q3ARG8_CHLCH